MAFIHPSSRYPVISGPVDPKPATQAAAVPAAASAPAPAAAVDLSPAAKAYVGGETNNVPWGSAPER